MNTTILNNIKRVLGTQNKDIKTFCKDLGITQQGFYTRFKGSMSIGNLQQIATALGVHITELLKDDTTATTNNNDNTATPPHNQIKCPSCGAVIAFSLADNTPATNE